MVDLRIARPGYGLRGERYRCDRGIAIRQTVCRTPAGLHAGDPWQVLSRGHACVHAAGGQRDIGRGPPFLTEALKTSVPVYGDGWRESLRWLDQSEPDPSVAESMLKLKYFAHCCSYSQQAAEKAVNSISYALGERTVLGHSVYELCERHSNQVPELNTLLPEASRLDVHYIPTRYPNGFPGAFRTGCFPRRRALTRSGRRGGSCSSPRICAPGSRDDEPLRLAFCRHGVSCCPRQPGTPRATPSSGTPPYGSASGTLANSSTALNSGPKSWLRLPIRQSVRSPRRSG